ncbi:twin-arginine translocase subunit TatC [Kitasatospora camelliae]
MALTEHLRELRNRLVKSVLAILVLTIAAAFFYREIIDFLTAPIPQCGPDGKPLGGQERCAMVSTIGLIAPFTLVLKVSLTTGLVAAVPVWLYQLWRFVAPGLHKHEKRYSLTFLGAGTPLFLGGVAFAYAVLPTTTEMLISLSPTWSTAIMPVDDYLDIATRMVVVFGLGFEFPLLLVMLNFAHVVTGKRLLGWWRGMVMGITVFAAFVTPGADPLSMLALAAPLCAFYFLAVGIAILNDKRRARRNPDAGLEDDEASELDLTVDAVAGAEAVDASAAPAATAAVPASRREEMDDIT